MTLGKQSTSTPGYARLLARKKKEAALAAAFPQGIKCQKCLEYGHWSYQCKGKRKILLRPSRTKILQKKLKSKSKEDLNSSAGGCKKPRKKVRKEADKSFSDCPNTTESDGEGSSSSSSSSSDSDSSEDSDRYPHSDSSSLGSNSGSDSSIDSDEN